MIKLESVILSRNGLSVAITKRIFKENDFRSYSLSTTEYFHERIFSDIGCNFESIVELNNKYHDIINSYKVKGFK